MTCTLDNFKMQNENCQIVFSPKSIFVHTSLYRLYNSLYNMLHVFEYFVEEFVYSEKSKPLIIYDGYKFRLHKTLQDALLNYHLQIR